MRLALALLAVLAAVAVSAVLAAVDGRAPCRVTAHSNALSLSGDCAEEDGRRTELSDHTTKPPAEGQHGAVSAGGETEVERDHQRRRQRQRGRRVNGRRRGGRRRGPGRRRKHRRRQRVRGAPGALEAPPAKNALRRRPCPRGFVRVRPRGRCLKRGGKQWKAANRGKAVSKPPTGDGRQVHASVRGRLSGSGSSPRGRPRCPEGYKRHRSGRCVLRLGARPATGRGPKPGALRGRAEQCTGGRVAWADGRCVPLATLRSCPKDSYRLSSGLCVRCWVSDKTDESCAKGCAVDERRAKCICCMPNGDDP